MIEFDPDRNPVEVLAEEFASCVRRGETPSVRAYAEQYPDLADEINALFPSIAMMESLGSRDYAERKLETSQAEFAATPIERLGDFRIIRQIGRGGMGVVYEAEQESLDRLVAVKVLASNAVASPRQLQRFHREAHSAASLHHTNIVPIFGVGQQDDVHYYVMQLIDGVGLDQIINELNAGTTGAPSDASSGTESNSLGTSAAAAAAALRQGNLVTAGRNSGTGSGTSWKVESHAHQSPVAAALATSLADTIVRHPPADANPLTAPNDAGSSNSSDSNPSGGETSGSETSGRETSGRETSGDHQSGEVAASDDVERSPAAEDSSAEAMNSTAFAPQKRRDLGDRYWKSVARMGVQLADALEYAHTQHVLHRDIKPSNLLLDRHGTVWITDFGLAKQAESDNLTNTGDIVGTLRYMAPEQFSGQCTASSDLYSLGVTLFELLTLRPAFGDSQQGMLIQKITSAGTPSLRGINPSIPRDLETIVLKATENDPNRRYSSAGQLADDLQRFLDDVPIQARRVTIPERMWRWSRRNPALAIASGSALLLLILVAVVATWGNLRTNNALDRVSTERDNVRKAKEEAEQASESAEENLAFAIKTFKNIISNIASRGVPAPLDIELEEGETAPHDTALTEADAQLLQELVEFFEEFAKNNVSDLREETADAYRSVGEIRRRLAQYGKAIAAYNKAMKTYQQLSENEPSISNVLARARILNEIGLVHRDKGDFSEAIRSHTSAVSILKKQPPGIADDRQCRFELVQTYLAMGSLWEPSGIISSDASTDDAGGERSPGSREPGSREPGSREPGSREPGPSNGREPSRENRDTAGRPSPESSRGDGRRNSSSRDGDRGSFGRQPPHELALVELERLIAEEPDNPDYKLAQARCYRMGMRSGGHSAHGDCRQALAQAIGILDTLVEQHPLQVAFKVELAETLLQTPIHREGEGVDQVYETNIQRAAEISQDLVSSFPLVHQYRGLLAGSERKLGAIAQQADDLDAAERHYLQAVRNLESLVKDHDSVIYQIALAQSRQRIGDLKREQAELDESHAKLQAAITAFDGFLAARRSNRFFNRISASLHSSMADTLDAMGKPVEAKVFREKARRLSRNSWRRRGNGGDDRGNQPGERPPRPENKTSSPTTAKPT